jgi:hypothetical protein
MRDELHAMARAEGMLCPEDCTLYAYHEGACETPVDELAVLKTLLADMDAGIQRLLLARLALIAAIERAEPPVALPLVDRETP